MPKIFKTKDKHPNKIMFKEYTFKIIKKYQLNVVVQQEHGPAKKKKDDKGVEK